MTTQHTPGPWDYVASTRHHGPYITSEFGTTIADFYTMTKPDCPSTANGGPSKPVHFMAEMADANARLAAAAPDLLEAAKSLLDCIPYNKISASKLEKIESARAAIAKAEGR